MKNGLYWFEHDLRISDNPALTKLARSVDNLVCVYCFSVADIRETYFTHEPLGPHRYRFLHEAIAELRQSLAQYHVELVVLYGEPVDVISKFITDNDITHVAKHYHTGYRENERLTLLKAKHPDVKFSEANAYTLYNLADLPMSLAELPDVFTPFRKKVEKQSTPRKPISAPSYLPATLDDKKAIYQTLDAANMAALPSVSPVFENSIAKKLVGGEKAAQAQMAYYTFTSNALAQYKVTRNGLDGWAFSSKLSAWLATGCISPRQVLAEITRYEQEVVANDSTYWLFFELLWREFFQWHALKAGYELYVYAGVQQQAPFNKHMKKVHQQWVNGTTPYPIINACMNQLRETGFMSNRGRQLVASCYVHELGQDWRYGAAYFQSMLIDYDPASNYGNWQYLAGVGCDPRGHRQFNLQKQADTYDPKGEFIAQWT